MAIEFDEFGPAEYRLTVDLTRYHPEFKEGVVGRAKHRMGMLDQFFVMVLPSGARLDVLWKSVEKVPVAEEASRGVAQVTGPPALTFNQVFAGSIPVHPKPLDKNDVDAIARLLASAMVSQFEKDRGEP